jgi:alkanesulfonate monooxygenase SsuD/methylene tetrahydromethanopterin reductase-like flavin-dependent oxidoreductase (luciferase family)
MVKHVLILGMDYGLVLFTSDRGITPAAAAKLADDHGFHTFYVPEHTHIPVKREAAHPMVCPRAGAARCCANTWRR